MYYPHREYVDHINVNLYSKDPDIRQITDIAPNPFSHRLYGEFKCIRGMIYYISHENASERLRERFGMDLVKSNSIYPSKRINRKIYYREIVEILLETNPKFKKSFYKACSYGLPFTDYRWLEKTYLVQKHTKALIDVYNELRLELEASNALSRKIN